MIPTDMELLKTGELITVDTKNGVHIFSKKGKYIRKFSNHEFLNIPGVYSVCRMTIDKYGRIYFSIFDTNTYSSIIAAYDQDGNYLATVLNDDIYEDILLFSNDYL
jgi:hypothetical protein